MIMNYRCPQGTLDIRLLQHVELDTEGVGYILTGDGHNEQFRFICFFSLGDTFGVRAFLFRYVHGPAFDKGSNRFVE